MKALLITMISLFSFQVLAGISTYSQMDKRFKNKNCAKTNSCDLKEFRVKADESIVYSPSFGTNYTTGAVFSYKTANLESLQKYAVVQFIKGCQYHSFDNGAIEYDIYRESFGAQVPFKHSNWVIDSVDSDPIYNSSSNYGDNRHAFYRWNELKDSFDKKTQHYYIQEMPIRPELYVSDRPGTAFYVEERGSAKNISLQFKTCIYKTKDIPREVNQDDINFAKTIKCYEWNSSYIYNHKTGKFNSPKSISKHCR